MNSLTENRLRQFLLAAAAAMCWGTIAELGLAGHTQEPLQWVPFILSGVGLAAVGAFWLRPAPTTVRILRVAMVLVALGGVIGVMVHLAGNREFVLETKPQTDFLASIWLALRGGAPALAPGILAMTASLAAAATYRHPALIDRQA